MIRVGPILSPRVDDDVYRQLAVWATKKGAGDWGVAHGWKRMDVFKILAGSRNMTFTQWILRDASGYGLTDAGVSQAERGLVSNPSASYIRRKTANPSQEYKDARQRAFAKSAEAVRKRVEAANWATWYHVTISDKEWDRAGLPRGMYANVTTPDRERAMKAVTSFKSSGLRPKLTKEKVLRSRV